MHLLKPAEKHYEWGSHSAIQNLAGFGSPGQPLAEIWYGAHPSGPATLGDGRTLNELISAEGASVLGEDVAERFGSALPFLVKLLAPGHAVSLQVHPSARRAREAYAQQLADPTREQKFVDANHKPEQILALTRFEGLVGLRPIAEAVDILASFDHPLTRKAASALAPGGERAIHTAITLLGEATAAEVAALVDLARALVHAGAHAAAETLLELADQYPGDPGVAVSLMLRRIRLEPGDSVMVDSGVPHAYMSGLALEVMANSDNVFRLGLTAKRVDLEESVANLITSPALVSRPHGAARGDGPDEFRLDVVDLRSGRYDIAGAGPRIAVALSGACTIHAADRAIALEPGHAVFLPHNTVAAAAPAAGSVAVISVPTSGDGRS